MGDSTVKALDKRYLLHRGTISKCRTATVSDALEKMSSGSKQEMRKVIFCVGLNDLRHGTDVNQIIRDMKSLIEETFYRHPHCYIYICSILPVNSPEITRDRITRLNAELENLQIHWERVFYVNTVSAFLNHDTPWALFEKDHVHPSKKGLMLLMDIIRRKVQFQQKSFHSFTSKPATPSTLSYASSVSGVHPINNTPVTNLEEGKLHNRGRLAHVQRETRGTQPSRLDSVDESHRNNRNPGGRVPVYMQQEIPIPPSTYFYPRYYSQMRPDGVTSWQGCRCVHQQMSPGSHLIRKMPEMPHHTRT